MRKSQAERKQEKKIEFIVCDCFLIPSERRRLYETFMSRRSCENLMKHRKTLLKTISTELASLLIHRLVRITADSC